MTKTLSGGNSFQDAKPNTVVTVDAGLSFKSAVGSDGQLFSIVNGAATFVDASTVVTGGGEVSGGTAGQIPYQTAPDTTDFISVGTAGQILKSNGTSAPTWTSTPSVTSLTATSLTSTSISSENITDSNLISAPFLRTTSTGLIEGPTTTILTPSLLFRNTNNNVEGLPRPGGGSNFILTSSSTTATPTWTQRGSVSCGSCTNVIGGAQGNLVYQTGNTLTNFVPNGTTGQILQSNGAAAPTWVSPTGLAAGSTATASNLAAGAAYDVPYQITSGNTGFVNGTGLLQSVSGTSLAFSTNVNLTQINLSTILDAAYLKTNGSGTLEAGTVLPESAGGTGQTDLDLVVVGGAAVATNIVGGLEDQLLVQTAANTTGFIPPQVGFLSYNGSNYVYDDLTSFVPDVAGNLAGGDAYQIPVQTADSITDFIPYGTANQVLTARAGAPPVWSSEVVATSVNIAEGVSAAFIETDEVNATTINADTINAGEVDVSGALTANSIGCTFGLTSASIATGGVACAGLTAASITCNLI